MFSSLLYFVTQTVKYYHQFYIVSKTKVDARATYYHWHLACKSIRLLLHQSQFPRTVVFTLFDVMDPQIMS